MFALAIAQISHFCDMAIPYNTTKARKIGIIHQDDTAVIATPNKLPLFGLEMVFTKYTVSHVKNVNENGT
jgi:hypothetical protein